MSVGNVIGLKVTDERIPRVGDLIVKRDPESRNVVGTGLVVGLGQYGRVKIHWNGTTPWDYDDKFGYSKTNIHNLRREYDVIRDGVEIS